MSDNRAPHDQTPGEEPASPATPQGDGLGRLMFAWRGTLFRRALAILGDEAAADDVVQAALLTYWQRRDESGLVGEPSDRPSPYCMGILVKLALNQRRARARRLHIERAASSQPGEEAPPAAASDPVQIAVAGEAWELVLTLPARERDILITRFGLGRTQQETADELGLPLGTVKSRERRALRALRKRYGVEMPGVAVPSGALLAERLVTLGAVPADFSTTVTLSTSTLAGLAGLLCMKGFLVMASSKIATSSGIVAGVAVVASLVIGFLLLGDSPTGPDPATPPSDSQARQASSEEAPFEERDAAGATPDAERERKEPVAEPEGEEETDSAAQEAPAQVERPSEGALEETTQPEQLVRGRVVNEAEEPVASATVMLVMASPEENPLFRSHTAMPGILDGVSTVTDEAGTFEIDAIRSHTTVAVVTVPPPPYAEAASPVVRPTVGEVTDVGDIPVPLGGTVEGHVVDERGNPVVGARIRPGGRSVTRQGSDQTVRPRNTLIDEGGREARSNARGTFRLGGIREGTASITVEAPGYLEQQVDGLQVVAGEATTIEVTLAPAITLIVTVTDLQQRAIVDAEVAFTPGGNIHDDPAAQPDAFAGQTDALGEATLRDVTFLDGTLSVRAAGFTRHRALKTLRVVNDNKARIDVFLGRPGRVTGRLLDAQTEQGISVPCDVAFTDPARPSRLTFRDATPLELHPDGSFTVKEVPTGPVRFMLRAEGYRWVERTFEIRDGDTHRLGDLYLERAVSAEVVVTEGDVPVEGARVTVEAIRDVGPNRIPFHMVFARTDRSGVATFDEISAERIRIRVLNEDSSPAATRMIDVATEAVDAAQPLRVRIDIREFAEVVGIYRDAAGEVAPGRIVSLMCVDDRNDVKGKRTDSDGRFVFDDVPPGTYRLRGQKPNLTQGPSVEVEVRGGETVTQDLQDPQQEPHRITILTHHETPYSNEQVELGRIRRTQGQRTFQLLASKTTDSRGRIDFASEQHGGVPVVVRLYHDDAELLVPLVRRGPRELEAHMPDVSRPSTLRISVHERSTDEPLDAVRVRISQLTQGGVVIPRELPVSADGTELTPLYEGSYAVTVVDPRFVRGKAVRLEVQPGERQTVTLNTTKAVSLPVRVHAQARNAASTPSRVSVRATCVEEIRTSSVGGNFVETLELLQLEAGVEYSLTVSASGYQERTVTVVPGPAAPKPLELQLEPSD